MTVTPSKSSFIETADGARLSYTRAGPESGQSIIFIPGWRQTAAQWKKQAQYFSTRFDVITYDHRGHGDSDNVEFGHRVSRYAADLHDLIIKFQLKNFVLFCHSMGCTVAWTLWDLYPEIHSQVAKMVLVDQPARFMADPSWTEEERRNESAIFQPTTAIEMAKNLDEGAPPFVKSMFTSTASPVDIEWALKQNFKCPDKIAGIILKDHASNDFRDVLPRITVPALVVAARGSFFPTEGVERVAKEIPGAKSVTFEAEEGGSHFMFWENPEKFNKIVEEFLAN